MEKTGSLKVCSKSLASSSPARDGLEVMLIDYKIRRVNTNHLPGFIDTRPFLDTSGCHFASKK